MRSSFNHSTGMHKAQQQTCNNAQLIDSLDSCKQGTADTQPADG